jgi:hypothetical protein
VHGRSNHIKISCLFSSCNSSSWIRLLMTSRRTCQVSISVVVLVVVLLLTWRADSCYCSYRASTTLLLLLLLLLLLWAESPATCITTEQLPCGLLLLLRLLMTLLLEMLRTISSIYPWNKALTGCLLLLLLLLGGHSSS